MQQKQSVPLGSVRNARELGGYKTFDGKQVKKGLLLRTAKLNMISDEDINILRDEYSVGDIIDFRFDMEIHNEEDRDIDGAVYHHIDVMDLSGLNSDSAPKEAPMDLRTIVAMMDKIGMTDGSMYIGFLENEKGKRGFREFFRILLSASPDRAVLWHCTSGKDRTGLAAMLLLSALGVDEATIISDYLLTNIYNQNRIFGLKQTLIGQGFDDEFIGKAALVFDAVDESFMRKAIERLKQKYGSVTGYIQDGLDIKQEEIDLLKFKYLI